MFCVGKDRWQESYDKNNNSNKKHARSNGKSRAVCNI